MEKWNDGIVIFQRTLSISRFIVKTNYVIDPTFQYIKPHLSNIPVFQHSNRGEASN